MTITEVQASARSSRSKKMVRGAVAESGMSSDAFVVRFGTALATTRQAMNVTPFLMFAGQAEEALRFYVSVLPNSTIDKMTHYGPGEPGQEGTVRQALATLANLKVMVIDSPVKHNFTFTPAVSLFVNVDSQLQLESLAKALAEGGHVLMPLGNYGFSQSFTWVQDRWGVSWQLNLP